MGLQKIRVPCHRFIVDGIYQKNLKHCIILIFLVQEHLMWIEEIILTLCRRRNTLGELWARLLVTEQDLAFSMATVYRVISNILGTRQRHNALILRLSAIRCGRTFKRSGHKQCVLACLAHVWICCCQSWSSTSMLLWGVLVFFYSNKFAHIVLKCELL